MESNQEEQTESEQQPNTELAETAENLAELKRSIDKTKAALSAMNKSYEEKSEVMIALLEAQKITSVKMFGFNFYTQITESVKTPKTLEEKRKLFGYLKEKGIFEEMVSVNSQTLNSFYKSMSAEAAKEGILDFQMPGIEEPKPFTELRLRKIAE